MHIDLTAADLKTVSTLLNAYLPGTTVWAFGSRVKFTSKPASDLDLVAFIQPEQENDLADLKEAFAESDLPFKVDILNWAVIPDSFKKNIESDYVVFQDENVENESIPLNWKKYKLGDISEIVGGGTPSTNFKEYWTGQIPWLTPRDLTNYQFRHISKGERSISELGLKNSSAKLIPENSILLTSRAPIGYLAIASNRISTNQGFKSFVVNKDKCDYIFLFYLLKNNIDNLKALGTGTTFLEISAGILRNIEFTFPNLLTQSKIAFILSSLDEKIELNLRMNKTLESIAQNIFKEWFVNFNFPGFDGELVNGLPKGWKIGILSDIAQVEIGRTPPRMEEQWFTRSPNDIKWISIRDLGQNGMYIFNTAEYLTKEAVERFRIPKIPTNSVVLSFKLTIGKLAITTEEMLSNEAIAQINSKIYGTEYVYSYLKNYNFDSLGSTSSIATATNSKVIKGMDFLIPQIQVVNKFTEIVNPIFKRLRNNSQEIKSLIQIRDSLLPRLMTGQLKVSA